ncbi:uncharacterized protein LOC133420526 [Cololabis saira]|uniref:uncharacterized protein LOC133420526 n=1 Tax=Cololabis saira TaxID=129043 RepID=UPI002AD325D1|nr:uncharacterized protein LOC133420526 [Cololabis saira]
MRNMNRITAMVYSLLLCASVVCGDTEVSCQFKKLCFLPCSFTAHNDVVVHWIQITQPETRVHSYYHNKDQPGEQDQRFRGRTYLFEDLISRGQASLVLRGVTVQDQGRYLCFTSTIAGDEESFINLNVDAPVQRVNIEKTQNKIICSSEGIYPEPRLTWTTSPPSCRNLRNPPTVQQNEQQLYSISSSLVLSDNDTDLDYICTVSTAANRRRTTLLKPAALNASDTETLIPCSPTNYPINYLIWRFNHSQIILTQSGAEDAYKPSERWKQHVLSVSETGSLMLKGLSSEQTGTYTCELTDEEETYVKSTFLHVPKDRTGVLVWGLLVGLLMGGVVVMRVKYVMFNDVMVEKIVKGEKQEDLVGTMVVLVVFLVVVVVEMVVAVVVMSLVMAVLLAEVEFVVGRWVSLVMGMSVGISIGVSLDELALDLLGVWVGGPLKGLIVVMVKAVVGVVVGAVMGAVESAVWGPVIKATVEARHTVEVLVLGGVMAGVMFVDTVDHTILLHRLHSTIRLRNTALDWFRSYLTERTECISLGGVKSRTQPVTCGVPQGSVLGPTLFTLYMLPLGSVISRHGLAFHCYADDTQLYIKLDPSAAESSSATLTICLEEIKAWMKQHFLQLNSGKTEAMLIGTPHHIKSSPITCITFSGQDIPLSSVITNLGVRMDPHLNYEAHINHLRQRSFFHLKNIAKLRPILSPKDARKTEYKSSLLTYQCVHGNAPPYLKELIHTQPPTRTRSANKNNLLKPTKTKLVTMGDRAFCSVAPKLWNALPAHLREPKSIDSFKRGLKTHLFSKSYASYDQ